MNVYKFIASGIRNKAEGGEKISSMSTRIGLISVAVSIFVIIVAICVVRGFRSEIRFKTSGFMAVIQFSSHYRHRLSSSRFS